VSDYYSIPRKADWNYGGKHWKDDYKKQMEVYHWLLRQNGLNTSNTGYFVYCTGRPDEKAFDEKDEIK
jgi:hypothetical protein